MIPNRVFSGEPVRAQTINDIIDSLNQLSNAVNASPGTASVYRLASACVNADAEVTISAGEPVYVTNESTWLVNTPVLKVIPYDGTHDDEYQVGVARFDMNAGERGEVVIRGLAVVNAEGSTEDGPYLEPDYESGGFVFTIEKTSFRYIGPVIQSDDQPAPEQVLALLAGEKVRGWGGGWLGVLTQRPSGGGGPAVWNPVMLDANGNWTLIASENPVIIPRF